MQNKRTKVKLEIDPETKMVRLISLCSIPVLLFSALSHAIFYHVPSYSGKNVWVLYSSTVGCICLLLCLFIAKLAYNRELVHKLGSNTKMEIFAVFLYSLVVLVVLVFLYNLPSPYNSIFVPLCFSLVGLFDYLFTKQNRGIATWLYWAQFLSIMVLLGCLVFGDEPISGLTTSLFWIFSIVGTLSSLMNQWGTKYRYNQKKYHRISNQKLVVLLFIAIVVVFDIIMIYNNTMYKYIMNIIHRVNIFSSP